jgi:hypothetical protein
MHTWIKEKNKPKKKKQEQSLIVTLIHGDYVKFFPIRLWREDKCSAGEAAWPFPLP